MYYYKIAAGDWKGVACSGDLRRWDSMHNMILVTDEEHCECIQPYFSDSLYRDAWMLPYSGSAACHTAAVTEIDRETYLAAIAEIDAEGDYSSPVDPESPVDDGTDSQDPEDAAVPAEALTMADVLEMLADHEMRLCMMEMGVEL